MPLHGFGKRADIDSCRFWASAHHQKGLPAPSTGYSLAYRCKLSRREIGLRLGRQPSHDMNGINFSSIRKTLAELGKNYSLTRLVLQRGLALGYLIAFVAVIHQFKPLLGEH